MVLHLNIIGYSFIALSLAHVIFPRYFRWKEELAQLSLVNRQMMQIHTLFLAMAVLLNGLLCVTSAREILATLLGKRIALGLGIFWGIRLVIQFVGYSPKLWRGKAFETSIHILFSLLWAYATTVFLWVALD